MKGASVTTDGFFKKDTVVKVPANLFRTMYSAARSDNTTKVTITTKSKKQFSALQISDGIETFLVIPTTASLR
jgi:hypothetical protein